MGNFRRDIDKKFASYPKSRSLEEFKEELVAALTERFQEYIREGHSEEQAYLMSIESIGDCKEAVNLIESGIDKKTKALRTKMAVCGSCLYWLIIVTAYLAASFITKRWSLTWIIFPVSSVIYLCSVLAVVFPKGRSLGKSLKIRISALLAFLIVTLSAYFLLSFFTREWEITWVAILIGIAFGMMFDGAMIKNNNKRQFTVYVHIIVCLLATVACNMLSFFEVISWTYSWFVYLFAGVGLLGYNFVNIFVKYKTETSFKN